MLTAAIARTLAAAGHGTFDVPGATIKLEELPAGDGLSVAFKTAPPALLAGFRLRGVQIVVRQAGAAGAGRARTGWEAADAVRDTLHGLRHVDLAAGTVDEERLVWMLSDDDGPTSLGDDGNGTPRWSLRFTALTPHTSPLTVGR